MVCFDGKLPKDVTLTNVYLNIEAHLQKTKIVCRIKIFFFSSYFPFFLKNLANEKLFNFLVNKVQPALDRVCRFNSSKF